MEKINNAQKQIKRRARELLLTPMGSGLPLFGGMTAVLLWLAVSCGTDALVSNLPFEVPMPIRDMMQLSVSLPLGVGALRYIAHIGSSDISELLRPFCSVRDYTDAWLCAVTFPLKCLCGMNKREVLSWFLLNLGHLRFLPVILLTGGIALFFCLPYAVVADSLFLGGFKDCGDLKDNNIKNINKMTGEIRTNGC